MATIEAQRSPSATRAPSRRIKVVIRRVSPLSVLKLSLLFYFCLMLIILIGVAILFAILEAFGVLDPIASLLSELGFGGGTFDFQLGGILRMLFLIGILSVVLWSAFTVFVAFLYNLIADLVGGIEVTLAERR